MKVSSTGLTTPSEPTTPPERTTPPSMLTTSNDSFPDFNASLDTLEKLSDFSNDSAKCSSDDQAETPKEKDGELRTSFGDFPSLYDSALSIESIKQSTSVASCTPTSEWDSSDEEEEVSSLKEDFHRSLEEFSSYCKSLSSGDGETEVEKEKDFELSLQNSPNSNVGFVYDEKADKAEGLEQEQPSQQLPQQEQQLPQQEQQQPPQQEPELQPPQQEPKPQPP